jgi:hypothetical protein
MLRERAVGESLWEAVLPEELRELPPELREVDAVLDDDRFLRPSAPASPPGSAARRSRSRATCA